MKLNWNLPFAQMFMSEGGVFPLKIEGVNVGDCTIVEVNSSFIVIDVDSTTFEKAIEIDPDLKYLLLA